VNRVRASVAGAHPGEAVQQALARYAGVTDAHLVPDDRPSLDAALLEARTLREVAPGSPARRAMATVAAQVDAMLAPVQMSAVVG
jgi:Flp pilus assembly CpaE family ATPase